MPEALGPKPESHDVNAIMKMAAETIRQACERFIGEPRDKQSRARYRTQMREMLYESMPPTGDGPAMDDFTRGLAADAGVDILEPFMFGLPEHYDPRAILGRTSDMALDLLMARFNEISDQLPFEMFRYEKLRRQGLLFDWGFERVDETHGRVWCKPVKPAEWIEVRFTFPEGEEGLDVE